MIHLTLDHAFKGEYVDLQSLLHIVFTQVSVGFFVWKKKKVPLYLFVFSNQLLKRNLYNFFIQEGIETTVFQWLKNKTSIPTAKQIFTMTLQQTHISLIFFLTK